MLLLEHSTAPAILLTCTKRYSVLKQNFYVLFEWLLRTGFTVAEDSLGNSREEGKDQNLIQSQGARLPIFGAKYLPRVLGNAESGVFYANFWFCTHTFPAGDSNLRQFFFLLTRLKLLKNT